MRCKIQLEFPKIICCDVVELKVNDRILLPRPISLIYREPLKKFAPSLKDSFKR